MKLIIGGATGLVGKELLEVLHDWDLGLHKVEELIPAASERSVGKVIRFKGKDFPVVSFSRALDWGARYAIFSAGSEVSRRWAMEYANKGITVIDNSSAWRSCADVPLVVPEVNASVISPDNRIIANPNCSTIQMVVALWPLHQRYGIKRIVVSTYQSVSGSGLAGTTQLKAEQNKEQPKVRAYPHPIHMNALPHGGVFLENHYTSEEQKLVDETRKILNAPDLPITATVARIPVTGGHSEAVNVELKNPFTLEEIRSLLEKSPGIKLEDNPSKNIYPMPLMVRGSNYTHVGRVRKDLSVKNGLNLWIVADNLRKGAATNAVQILSALLSNAPPR